MQLNSFETRRSVLEDYHITDQASQIADKIVAKVDNE